MYNLLTLLSYLLSGASISLAILKPDLPTWIFPIPAVFGWILGFMMVKKVSKPVHIVANVLGGLSIGVALDMICDSFPLFTISLAFILSTFAVRVILIRSMGYVKYLWFEPMMLIAGLGVFIAVNIIKHPGWYGWAIPAPMAFMSVMFSMVGVKEQKAFKRAATKELNVEVGQPAPDFSLPDENGKIVTVSEFKGVQPVLLLFVRGDWCPTCHIMLRTYERNNDQFKKRNVCVMGIGPVPQGVNKAMVEKMSISFHILSDDKQEALKKYGITFLEPMMGQTYEIGSPLPASILIDKKGIVRHICRADRAGEFLNPMQIFAVLEKMDQ